VVDSVLMPVPVVPAPTYTGDGGPSTSATFLFPNDVQADGAGNVYLTESGRVHKISPSGIITTLLSGGQNNSAGSGSSHTCRGQPGDCLCRRCIKIPRAKARCYGCG